MRVSFDSNVWEKIFDPTDAAHAPVRAAIRSGRVQGFICEMAFRIEAVRKRSRPVYFAEPHADLAFHGVVSRDGQPYLHLSIGPNDAKHPGLPSVQADKLRCAFAAGVRVMRGLAWMGLPAPEEIRDAKLFASEAIEAAKERERRQIEAFRRINNRGVGKALFDAVGGWDASTTSSEKKFNEACAEWADGELVSAHIAYGNDILCTNDRAKNARVSIFNENNRAWASNEFGVVFMTLDELTAEITNKA
jgi:hypothetical protein